MSSCGIETEASSHTQTGARTSKEAPRSNCQSQESQTVTERVAAETGCLKKKVQWDSYHQPCCLTSLQAAPQRIKVSHWGKCICPVLPCILFQLLSECQAPLNRAASRSSWRQEPTPTGTEAGSHCGLAGLLFAQACPLLSIEQHLRHGMLMERSILGSRSEMP